MWTNNISNKTNPLPPDPVEDIFSVPRPIVAMAKEFPSGHLISFHQHSRAQLLYASSGVMTVKTNNGIWVVPPLRAVWIPAYTRHQIEVSGNLSMRTLYIDPTFFPGPSEGCCVIAVSPLLKELILYAVGLPQIYPLGGQEERVLTVILDQICNMSTAPLELQIPVDSRLKKIYRRLSTNPGENRTLEDWGKTVGATGRTLARHFRLETGMSFVQWRQQIRILEALRRLGRKEPVTTVAIELGYDSPSAFISMFKKALGKTPGQYFAE
jgi:AraC-like DNA-binding protein/mannose-6-phosphate isomerase-like protein (cupin superfamily)